MSIFRFICVSQWLFLLNQLVSKNGNSILAGIRTYCVHLALSVIPPTRCYGLKRALFRWAGLSVGSNTRIVSSVQVMTSGPVSIGNDTFIGHECLIVGGDARIEIGANVDISPRVTIVTGTHKIESDGPHVAGAGYSLPVS